ncbi:MAG: SCP2 sterol-binding domain-containing protein [Acidimicrobiales bacterium]
MSAYAFLSPEWTEAARKIRAEYDGPPASPAVPMRMNLVVTEVPFGEGTIDAHLDTSAGDLVLDEGHLEGADLKVTVDYATAKAILVEGNPQAGLQAFMAGRIKVEGDMSKLMTLQGPPDAATADIASRIREITE